MPDLRSLRTACGISVEEMAEATCADVEHISKWEEGVETPNGASAVRLAECLNLPLKEVYLAILNTPMAGADL